MGCGCGDVVSGAARELSGFDRLTGGVFRKPKVTPECLESDPGWHLYAFNKAAVGGLGSGSGASKRRYLSGGSVFDAH